MYGQENIKCHIHINAARLELNNLIYYYRTRSNNPSDCKNYLQEDKDIGKCRLYQ